MQTRPLPKIPGEITVICGLVLILVATPFPFDFSFDEHRSLSNSFRLASAIESRRNDLLIGVDGALGQNFKGRLDEIRIYRRAMTGAEIAQEASIYRAGQGDEAQSAQSSSDPGRRDSPMEELVASYSFDERSGTVAEDGSGNRNHGALVNDPEWITGRSGGG